MTAVYTSGFYPQNLKVAKLTEDELEEAVANGDYELVYRAMSPMVKTVASQYYRWYCSIMEYEDVYQISMIALWLSMENYKPDKEYKFSTYAYSGMARMIQRYKQQLTRQKKIPPTMCTSIDAKLDENDSNSDSMIDFIATGSRNEVEEKLIYGESLKEIADEVSKVKSDSQREILTLALVDHLEQPYIVKKVGKRRQYVNKVINDFVRKTLNKSDYLYTD